MLSPRRGRSSAALPGPPARRHSAIEGRVRTPSARGDFPGDVPVLEEILCGGGNKRCANPWSVIGHVFPLPVTIMCCHDNCTVRTKPSLTWPIRCRHAVCTFQLQPEMWKPRVFIPGSQGESHGSPFRKGRSRGAYLHPCSETSEILLELRPSVAPPPVYCFHSLTSAPLALAKFTYS